MRTPLVPFGQRAASLDLGLDPPRLRILVACLLARTVVYKLIR